MEINNFQAYDWQRGGKEPIDDFVAACDEAIDCKAFILAESRIKKVLQTIAASTQLYGLVAAISNNFDMNVEIEKLRAIDNFGRLALFTPENKVLCAGLVYRILLDIDCYDMDEKEKDSKGLRNFLTKYYNRPEMNQSYREFAQALILPFKDCMLYLLKHPEQIDAIA